MLCKLSFDQILTTLMGLIFAWIYFHVVKKVVFREFGLSKSLVRINFRELDLSKIFSRIYFCETDLDLKQKISKENKKKFFFFLMSSICRLY